MSDPLVKISLCRPHAKTVTNGASSHKGKLYGHFSEIKNIKGHLNYCIGSKVTTILLIGLIFPIGGVASGRVCPAACATGSFVQVIDMTIEL